eukprot:CAMPEP_0113725616 /NCGR_PEP_ID=MMETSP0038_2-20120614/39879_1 /TAXON_ID=2898 /ORGANISM="Cryptomonas paramecium" /LENGTH=38 /DNA_ID=CAMNT_0000655939 /DNA_START=306 /DNA_END=419 /DNA_ORIENTATION=- /assembly_acc=CAM_ASM_000170
MRGLGLASGEQPEPHWHPSSANLKKSVLTIAHVPADLG